MVVTLSDGKDRSFILASATPVQVKGKAAKDGLSDPAIKPGASAKVVTEPGGRKVKEVSEALPFVQPFRRRHALRVISKRGRVIAPKDPLVKSLHGPALWAKAAAGMPIAASRIDL